MAFLSHLINRLILILSLLIFFIPNASAVAVVNITQLTYGTNTSYGNPSWSPDGSKIAYSYISGSNYSLWIMNSNGSNPVPLTRADFNNPVHKTSAYWVDSEPRWSSDGSRIVFQRNYYDEGGGHEGNFIYIINMGGSNQRMFFGATGSPAISPDGKYIAFQGGNIKDIMVTPEQGYGIYVMEIYRTNIKILTDDLGDELTPSWSPDGKRIVFTKGGIDGTIHIMNSDGSNMVSTGQQGIYPRWSPDGKYIAFISRRSGDMFRSMRLFHIYIMDIDGTNVTQLTFGDKRSDGVFDWSPDGTKIIFGSAVPPTLPTSISNLYIMTLDFNVTPTSTLTATQPTTVASTITQIATTQTPSVPSFSLLSALVSLFILVLIRRIK
jgi:TolB protein